MKSKKIYDRQTTSQESPASQRFPPGWDKERVEKVLAHYEGQTEEDAVAEDEAAYNDPSQTLMEVPNELVPRVRELIAKHKA